MVRHLEKQLILARLKYKEKKMQNCGLDPKKIWKQIKTNLNKNNKQVQIINSLKIKGEIITDPMQ